MAVPTLTPSSETSRVILPVTGTSAASAVAANYPFGIYAADSYFQLGAKDQVNFVYRKLGGNVLDIELTEKNVFAAYEEAVLEYSYIVNIHQAKNALPSALGNTTGTFDQDGEQLSTSPMTGTNAELRYPKFDFGYSRRVFDGSATEIGMGGTEPIYSASFETVQEQQDYDLQAIIQTSSSLDSVDFTGLVNKKRILVKKVFYKTPHSMWRFYGYYGGLNTIGNLSTYGMYGDDSTWEVIPPWQNKLQAMAYEDAIYTRNSHYSYEIKNNKIRVFPLMTSYGPARFWFTFTIQSDVFTDQSGYVDGTEGINNMNTLPFANIRYKNINSIGKQWIRRFALALCKEMLGQVRGKFATIPIPGNDLTLNASDLLSQAKEEQEKLREELKTVLDEMVYSKVVETQNTIAKAVNEVAQTVPMGIYTG
jgi:hypothetical protein